MLDLNYANNLDPFFSFSYKKKFNPNSRIQLLQLNKSANN